MDQEIICPACAGEGRLTPAAVGWSINSAADLNAALLRIIDGAKSSRAAQWALGHDGLRVLSAVRDMFVADPQKSADLLPYYQRES